MRSSRSKLETRRGKRIRIGEAPETPPTLDENDPIVGNIEACHQRLLSDWACCDDLRTKTIRDDVTRCLVIWISGLTNETLMQNGVFESLASMHHVDHVGLDDIENNLAIGPLHRIDTFESVNRGLANGGVVIFVDGHEQALVVDVCGFAGMQIDISQNEPSIQGPQEAFTQNQSTNISQIRKIIRSPRLKVQFQTYGTISHTQVALIYIDGVLKPSHLDEAKRRLSRLDIDIISDTNILQEALRDAPYSPFPTIQSTERPDRVAAAVAQGRLAIMIDGSPYCIVTPSLFVNYLSSAEDYYGHYMISLPIRILRHVMFWMSMLLPATYLSLLSFNQDLVPTPLLINLESQHERIPFPTYLETLGMQFSFEALREAGIRLPKAVGQSVSIVGALVIGEAAVTAGIVSPGIVIVIASCGVASFVIPSYQMVNAVRILQFVFTIIASIFGLYGVVLGMLVLLMHLVSIRSWGVPYMSPISPFNFRDMKDVFVRAPWWNMSRRPVAYEAVDQIRNKLKPPKPNRGDRG